MDVFWKRNARLIHASVYCYSKKKKKKCYSTKGSHFERQDGGNLLGFILRVSCFFYVAAQYEKSSFIFLRRNLRGGGL